ncbi:MAG: nickel insertion protein [Gemmataceae bacterium]
MKYLDQPNLLRVFVGEAPRTPATATPSGWWRPTSTTCRRRWSATASLSGCSPPGALDVFTPIQMKKSRPGVLLSVIAPAAAVGEVEAVLFRETQTFGVRKYRPSGRSPR